MRWTHFAAAVALAGPVLAARVGAQRETGPTPPPARIYDFGSTSTAPQLLHFDSPINAPADCHRFFDGKVKLLVQIDASGNPSEFYFTEPHGDDLDRFAVQILKGERFNPATVGGAPVAVRASLEMSLKSCVEETQNPDGSKSTHLRLRESPKQTLSAPKDAKPLGQGKLPLLDAKTGTTAPLPLNTVAAELRYHIAATCQVSISVDEHGMPQDPKIVKSVEPDVDRSATTAAMRYRFKPAMRNGVPVPVVINVLVVFRPA